jgi:hypothetical protein
MYRWGEENYYLLTNEELDRLPVDTIVENPRGSAISIKDIKPIFRAESHLIYRESGIGYVEYGIRDPWNHPLKDLFLVFLLKS